MPTPAVVTQPPLCLRVYHLVSMSIDALFFPRRAVADPSCCRHYLPELALLLQLRTVCAPPEFRVKRM